jgi:hypothetical protein
MNRIEDLEDIIKILVSMLERNNVSKDIIRLELRTYHYCYDCMNHYRGCKCDEEYISSNDSSSLTESYDDSYTSSSQTESYDDSDIV